MLRSFDLHHVMRENEPPATLWTRGQNIVRCVGIACDALDLSEGQGLAESADHDGIPVV